MRITENLKPCPFCGSNNVSINPYPVGYFCVCEHCFTSSDTLETVQEVIEAWNTRHEQIVPEPKCRWKYDYYMDAWETECGNAFQTFADTPKENGFEYCPYCGGELMEE